MFGGLASPPGEAFETGARSTLDRHLRRDIGRPVALGLSGGSDSLALLHLAAAWALQAGRPLLALTVDHGLSPESAGWTARAGAMAKAAGADWRALGWRGPHPSTGLPAAARAARHRLLAEAAREAGACVILLAHTADDRAEGDWMRATGAAPALGDLGAGGAWSPSPVWPEGRGLFLLRPLLHARRAALRSWLEARGLTWIDDPANADVRFARARARAALADGDCSPSPRKSDLRADAFTDAAVGCDGGSLTLDQSRLLAEPRPERTLAAALVCVGGGERLPGREAADGALRRLTDGTDAALTLAGAHATAADGVVRLARERGRRPVEAMALTVGVPAVWDGRFEVIAKRPGWTVRRLYGHAARLPPAERAALRTLDPAVRAALPAFVSPQGDVRLAPSFGDAPVAVRALVLERLRAALGAVTREP